LIHNSSIHVGIRAPLSGKDDIRNDKRCGFEIIKARQIDRIGIDGVIRNIKERVGDTRVYINVDIDVLDPAFAPGKFAVFSFQMSTNHGRGLFDCKSRVVTALELGDGEVS